MSEQTLFRAILKRSWYMMVARPSMWILAFFAAAVAGVGVVDAVFGAWNILKTAAAPAIDFSSAQGSVVLTWLTPPYTNLYLPMFALLFMAISIGLFLVSVISLGGLIRAAVDKKEHTIKSSWNHGVEHLWDLLGLVIARRMAIALLLLAAALICSALLRYAGRAGVALTVLTIVIFVVLVLIVSLLAVYAQSAVVVDRVKFLSSFGKAWDAFRRHKLLSLEMAVTLFIVELAFAIGAAIIFLLIVAPLFLLFVVSGITGVASIAAIAYIIGFILISTLSFLVAAWSTQFTVASWAFLYVKIRKETIKSRILHYFGRR